MGGTSFELGSCARGTLGPSCFGASAEQMQAIRNLLQWPTSYTGKGLRDEAICIDDRVNASNSRIWGPRLAGGGLTLIMMHDTWDGGTHELGVDQSQLRDEHFRLATHQGGCGALKAAPKIITQRLVNPDTCGYGLLRRMGIETPDRYRVRVAAWAKQLTERSFESIAIDGFDDSEQLVGEHRAVGVAVCLREGHTFIAEAQLAQVGNLLVFAFDPWMADRTARQMPTDRDSQAVAALMGKVFTAEVLLELGGSDLFVNVFE